MASRGKLIVIEGIDGSGKQTQTALLGRALEARGVQQVHFSFPRYESSFGQLIGQFLNGDFGKLDGVDPHLSALLYAGDRLEAKPDIEAALAAGGVVLLDRYIGSNLAHQTARVDPEKRAEFQAWLERLEYVTYGLPAEDLVIYLRIAAVEAQELVGRKATRGYTSLKRDLQEADLHHLEQAALVYDGLARRSNWMVVECFDGTTHALRSAQEIHREILAGIESRVLSRMVTS